jgi:hypothetical protein
MTLRGVRRLLGRAVFERGGIQTSAVVRLEDLGVAGEGREFYAPAGWLTLHRALPRAAVGPADVFLDLGSRMGRVLIQAARRYPFRRVIGLGVSTGWPRSRVRT